MANVDRGNENVRKEGIERGENQPEKIQIHDVQQLRYWTRTLGVSSDVLVSVRNAIAGTNLGQLREAVQREFLHLDEQEKNVRSVLAKMEGDLMRRMATFHNA